MNYKLFFTLFSISILVLIIPIQQSFAINPTTVFFTYPTNDNPLVSTSPVTFTGGFTDDFTTMPTLTFSLDDGTKSTIQNNIYTWSNTIKVSPGWHTATINLSDTKVIRSETIQFLLSSGHPTTTKYNVIFIIYSEACYKILQQNITNICPTLNKLMSFDTTQKITGTGHFIKISNGNTLRTKPEIKNYWIFFQSLNYKPVCVDCYFNLNQIDTVQKIFIEPSNFTFSYLSTPTNTKVITSGNNTISQNEIGEKSTTIGFTRFVSPDCLTASIYFTPKLLADTISYLNNGCKATSFNLTSIIKPMIPIVDPTTSQSWKNQQWLKQSLKINIGNCITMKCKSLKDPNSKW